MAYDNLVESLIHRALDSVQNPTERKKLVKAGVAIADKLASLSNQLGEKLAIEIRAQLEESMLDSTSVVQYILAETLNRVAEKTLERVAVLENTGGLFSKTKSTQDEDYPNDDAEREQARFARQQQARREGRPEGQRTSQRQKSEIARVGGTVGGGSKLKVSRETLEDLNSKFGFAFDPMMTGLNGNAFSLILNPPAEEAGGVQMGIELLMGYAPKDWSAKKKAEAVVALALAVKASNLTEAGANRMKMKWNEPEGWTDEVKQAIRAIAAKG